MHDVRVGIEQHLGARARVHAHGGEVGHGAAGKEERRIRAEQLGHPRFKGTGGGIAVEDVIADVGGSHRGAHASRGTRHGITAQVEHVGHDNE
jgi:hypothetical protein